MEAFTEQLQQNPAVLFVATDGSEHLDVGSFAVFVQPGDFRCAAGNSDEDEAAYKQELLAFEVAVRALQGAWTESSLQLLAQARRGGPSLFARPRELGCAADLRLGSLARQKTSVASSARLVF